MNDQTAIHPTPTHMRSPEAVLLETASAHIERLRDLTGLGFTLWDNPRGEWTLTVNGSQIPAIIDHLPLVDFVEALRLMVQGAWLHHHAAERARLERESAEYHAAYLS